MNFWPGARAPACRRSAPCSRRTSPPGSRSGRASSRRRETQHQVMIFLYTYDHRLGADKDTTGKLSTDPGAVNACSSEADKLDQQMADCERDALERAIELGLGHHRPPLTGGGIVDPRKINPSPEWVPPDPTGLSSCLGLSGDQIPSDPSQCGFLLCADPYNCQCGSPSEPGGSATTNENANTVRPSCTEVASSGSGNTSTPFPCNTTTAAAKPSTCLAINCGEQELDRATCFCKPREAGTRDASPDYSSLDCSGVIRSSPCRMSW
jgi:hypothetical protein